MTRKIINSYPRFITFQALIDSQYNQAAVRSGLVFQRFVGEEYVRKEVYDQQEYDHFR